MSTSLRLLAAGAVLLNQPLMAQTIGPSSAWLALLPDGETKRKFILDCTGCHQFDEKVARVNGRPRSEGEWREAVTRMLGYAGARTSFPVISADREARKTAAWLVQHLDSNNIQAASPPDGPPAEITELLMPDAKDLPHDIAVEQSGTVLVTGMFTHRLYRLDPGTGQTSEIAIPVANANPRAIEIDSLGQPWVVLGMPKKLAVMSGDSQWRTFDVGMYPHSLAVDRRGKVWFNGHFTHSPELLGNRIFAFDGVTGKFEVFPLPLPHSGPRRLDVDAGGIVWIPSYAANGVLRFDPRARTFTEIPLPLRDAIPYIIRVDYASGALWIGTAAADALLRYDPATGRFESYRLPSRGAVSGISPSMRGAERFGQHTAHHPVFPRESLAYSDDSRPNPDSWRN